MAVMIMMMAFMGMTMAMMMRMIACVIVIDPIARCEIRSVTHSQHCQRTNRKTSLRSVKVGKLKKEDDDDDYDDDDDDVDDEEEDWEEEDDAPSHHLGSIA